MVYSKAFVAISASNLLLISWIIILLQTVPSENAISIWWKSLTGNDQQSMKNLRGADYHIEIISKDPLMIYLDHFIKPTEVKHLLQLGAPLYKKSLIFSEGEIVPESYRTSDSCVLPDSDSTVLRVKQRVSSLLGFLPHDHIEALQLVRYQPSQLFALHNDWFDVPKLDSKGRSYNRVASVFLYLEANCVSGATFFPRLPGPPAIKAEDPRFSTTIEGDGLGITPMVGNGVFWVNLRDNFTGDERTLHAGLPVREGSKIGMNIWINKYVD